jgi:hypothetical protein
MAWKSLTSSVAETASSKVMAENYKKCPNCKVFIDKNKVRDYLPCPKSRKR